MKTGVTEVTLVAVQELATPPAAITINDFVDVWPNGSLLGFKYKIQQLAQVISDQLGSGSILTPRVYRIGVSMPAGASLSPDRRQIIDPYLNGKAFSMVFRRGIELMVKGVEYDNTVPGGGIQLLRGGPDPAPYDTFVDTEVVTVYFDPAFSPYIPGADAIARFTSGEQIITSSSTITSGMFRKLIIIRGSTAAMSVNLPLASAYPENVGLFIVTDGGVNIQTTLNCAGSDVINYKGQTLSQLFLGQNNQLCLIPTSGGWRVQMFKTEDDIIGTVSMGYLAGPNQFAATTTTPQLRANYPRVWDFIKRLYATTPSAVVSNAVWVNNKGLWGLGDGDLVTGTTFNFPYLSGQFLRALDPSGIIDTDRAAAGTNNLPGNLQLDQFRAHNHAYLFTSGNTGAHTIAFTAGGVFDTTSTPTTTGNAGGAETRPVNIGLLPLINI